MCIMTTGDSFVRTSGPISFKIVIYALLVEINLFHKLVISKTMHFEYLKLLS